MNNAELLNLFLETTMDESQPSTVSRNLLGEFRSLTILLSCVTAINNNGVPALASFQNRRDKEKNSKLFRSISLNSLVNILIRHYEVMAAVAYPPLGPSELIAFQQSQDEADDDADEAALKNPVSYVSGFVNSDDSDKSTYRANCKTFPAQPSYWEFIRDNEWYGLGLAV